jgi:cell division protein FtsW
MAILAEELGFVVVLAVLGLILWMVLRALSIGNKALEKGRAFDGYMAYSIGIWFSFQTAVNIGASAGILPTKGLTLPLVSYGGSSLIVMSVAVAILLRIDFELRVDGVQAIGRGDGKDGKKRTRRKKPFSSNEVQAKETAKLEKNTDDEDFSSSTVEAKPATKKSTAEDEGKAGIKAILARVAQEADNG